MSNSSKTRGPLWLALATLLCVPLAGAIDAREFACEEALKHVEDCCPGVHQPFTCGAACDEVDTTPAIADCLRRSRCDELVASGACGDPLGSVCQ